MAWNRREVFPDLFPCHPFWKGDGMVNAHKLLESGDSKTAQARVPKLELMEDVSEFVAMGGGLELLVGQGINGRAADGALGHT